MSTSSYTQFLPGASQPTPQVFAPRNYVPIVAPAPTIPVAHVGQTIVGTVGLWVNGVLGYMYQLLRNGVVFQSGNWTDGSMLYIVQPTDVGTVISLVVTAQNNAGAGSAASSAPLLVVY